MAIETLYADAHLVGDFPTPENAIGNTPTTWAGTTNANTNYTSRWSLADPVDSLTSGAQQTVSVLARKGTNSGTPTIALNLYIAGTLVASRTAQNVTSTTGEVISVTFTAAEMTPPMDAEIEIIQISAGGNPSTRNCAEVAYIEWQADTSPEVTPTTAPTITIDAVGETTVDLSWTAVDGVDTYELQRDLVTIQNTSARTRNDTGLNSSTSYDYQVRAVNSAGAGPWSDIVTATTIAPSAPPEAITDLSATSGDGQVTLSWTAPASNEAITDYEYRIDAGAWVSTGSTAVSYIVSGLTNGTQYAFEVRAVSSVGAGAASNTATATPSAPAPPTAPYFTDDFNRVDEVPIGAPWVLDQPGNYSLISNAVRGGQTGAGWEVAYVETSENGSTSDKLVLRADVTLPAQGNVGLGLFIADDSNWIGTLIDNDSFNIRKLSADVGTVLTTNTLHGLTVDGVATYQIEAEYTPSTGVLRFLIDGVEKETYTLTAAEQTEYASRTTHGLFNFSGTSAEIGNTIIDNFVVTDSLEPISVTTILGNTGSFVPSTNVASHTTQFSVGAGANRVLVVFIPQKRSPLRDVVSITFNGVAGTVSAPVTDASNNARVAAYYWLEADLPAAGTYDCVVTFNNSNNVFSLLAMEFENAPQVVPSGVGTSGSAVQLIAASDTVEVGSLSVAALMADTNNAAPAEPTITGEQAAGPGADFGGAENQTRSGYILVSDDTPTVEWSTVETWDPVALLLLTFEDTEASEPGTFSYEAWGHSYLVNDAPSPGAHYRDLIVSEDADAIELINNANGGFTIPEMAAELVGLTTDDTWAIGATGIRVLIDGVLNDLQEKDSVAKALAAAEEAIRAMCAIVSAASFTPHTDAAFSYTGTWNGTSSLTSARSGSQNSTSDPTATISITVDGPDHFLHVFGKDDAVSVGANFDITVDGSPFGSFTTRDKMLRHPTDLGPSFVNMVIPLRDLGAGSHDIVLTKTDDGTLNFDGLSTMAATDRTPVILVKDQYLDWVASPGTYGSDAGLDAYNARLDLVAAEFDNVFVADPSEGWDIATMIGVDNVHLTDAGHRHFADAILAVQVGAAVNWTSASLNGSVRFFDGTNWSRLAVAVATE